MKRGENNGAIFSVGTTNLKKINKCFQYDTTFYLFGKEAREYIC